MSGAVDPQQIASALLDMAEALLSGDHAGLIQAHVQLSELWPADADGSIAQARGFEGAIIPSARAAIEGGNCIASSTTTAIRLLDFACLIYPHIERAERYISLSTDAAIAQQAELAASMMAEVCHEADDGATDVVDCPECPSGKPLAHALIERSMMPREPIFMIDTENRVCAQALSVRTGTCLDSASPAADLGFVAVCGKECDDCDDSGQGEAPYYLETEGERIDRLLVEEEEPITERNPITAELALRELRWTFVRREECVGSFGRIEITPWRYAAAPVTDKGPPNRELLLAVGADGAAIPIAVRQLWTRSVERRDGFAIKWEWTITERCPWRALLDGDELGHALLGAEMPHDEFMQADLTDRVELLAEVTP